MTPPRPRVIVTRPAREAARWVAAFAERGIEAVALPLIEIAPLPARRPGPGEAAVHAALMFVSATAVEHFFKAAASESTGSLATTVEDALGAARCWATGPGTVQALRRAGVPPDRIDAPDEAAARFDSEALWTRVQPQVRRGTRVLLVRGGDASGHPTGRDWLSANIAAAGGQADAVVVYRRLAPVLDDAGRQLAAAASQGGAMLWLFTSALAVAHLGAAMPHLDWRKARALATHPRIAQAARHAGFGDVRAVSPRLEDMVASIESIR